MNQKLYYFLFFLLNFNLYFSQNSNDISFLFDGEVRLENELEYTNSNNNSGGLSIIVKINDKEYKFLIDTGFSTSALNERFFSDLTVGNKKKIKVQDAVGVETENEIFYMNFTIGNNEFSNFAFIKVDLSKVFGNNCIKYDGIIGGNVLKKLNWKYLKSENKLFFSKNPFNYDGFNKASKVQWYGSIPAVELKINDYKFWTLVDTGFFGTIIIPVYVFLKNYKYGYYYNLIRGKGFPTITVNGKQELDLRKAEIEGLGLDDYDFSNYEVVVAKTRPMIGNGIFVENGFIFNFLNNEIAFGKSDEKSKYAVLPKLKICKSEADRSKLELCFFWKEPDNKKLKVGDQIIQIDSMDTTKLDDAQYCSILDYLNKKEGSKKITFKRGKKIFEYILN